MNNRKLKIYREEAKDRSTSHWDLDCMTTEQLEEVFSANRESAGEEQKSRPGVFRRLMLMLGLGRQN